MTTNTTDDDAYARGWRDRDAQAKIEAKQQREHDFEEAAKFFEASCWKNRSTKLIAATLRQFKYK